MQHPTYQQKHYIITAIEGSLIQNFTDINQFGLSISFCILSYTLK